MGRDVWRVHTAILSMERSIRHLRRYGASPRSDIRRGLPEHLVEPGRSRCSLKYSCRPEAGDTRSEWPICIGRLGLYQNCERGLPSVFLKAGGAKDDEPTQPTGWSIMQRLEVQHSRNFAPSVVAARTGEFEGVKHLVDIAGGSGVFAIPLAGDHPRMRITLVEAPNTIAAVREFLDSYGVGARVDLVGMDIFRDEWNFGQCDGIVFGNFYHATDDDGCRFLTAKSFETLAPRGRIWLHEVLFNENRDGPLVAALWNANMAVRRKGAKQRTASELKTFLDEAGFENFSVRQTAGGFSLVGGSKPA
jgi:hypothetical protein